MKVAVIICIAIAIFGASAAQSSPQVHSDSNCLVKLSKIFTSFLPPTNRSISVLEKNKKSSNTNTLAQLLDFRNLIQTITGLFNQILDTTKGIIGGFAPFVCPFLGPVTSIAQRLLPSLNGTHGGSAQSHQVSGLGQILAPVNEAFQIIPHLLQNILGGLNNNGAAGNVTSNQVPRNIMGMGINMFGSLTNLANQLLGPFQHMLNGFAG